MFLQGHGSPTRASKTPTRVRSTRGQVRTTTPGAPTALDRRVHRVVAPLLSAVILIFTQPVMLRAQNTGEVRGRVVDGTTNRPVVGAQLVVTGSGRGGVTGPDGSYQIGAVRAGAQTVRVVMLGYATLESPVNVPAGGTATADFALQPSAINLEEVVVTGSGGSTERRRLGNSLATLDVNRVIETAPIAGFENLMQARTAGVAVLPSGGTVGTSGVLRVRGITSLSQGEDPLVYVDGVRVDISSDGGPGVSGQSPSRMLDIIPSDIERVEIIKGAAAATLYGTEASNGVVQIFTKRGQAGAPRWTLQIEQGVERAPSNFPGKLYPNFEGPTGVRARDTNDLIGTGHQQSYSLSLSGGEQSLTYYLSGSFRDDEGTIVPEINYLKQASGRMNLTAVPYETLSLQMNLGYVHTKIRLPNNDNSIYGVSGNATAGVPYQATEERRWGENFLPVHEAMKIENIQSVGRTTGGLTIEHRPFEALNHRATFGIDVINQEDTEFYPYGYPYPQVPLGRKENARRTRSEITLDYRAVLSSDFGPGFTSSLAAGTQGTFTHTATASVNGRDFPGPGLSTASSAAVITGDEGLVDEVNAGVFVEETVGWNDKLFVTGAVRVDGNSAFGDDFTYQAYPKASVAYNISEDAFWPSSFWPTMKVRLAYGTSGLAPAQFAADRTWNPTSVLEGVPAVTPGNLGNRDLAPERSEEIEVGFDAGLLDDRVGIVVTYYRQKTEDALLGVPSPPSLGFTSSQLTNIGEVRNTGWEVELRNLWVTTPDLQVETGLFLSTHENEIIDLGGTGGFSHGFGAARAEEGRPVYGQYLLGELTWDPVSRTHSRTNDPAYVGSAIPTHRGSLTGTVTLFGRLSLNGLLDWAGGHHVANLTKQFQTQGRTGDEYLALVEAPRGVRTAAGDSLVNYVNTMRQSSFISPGDFTKLRELSVSYRIPEQWVQRIGLGATTVRVAGRNLITWTDYDGVDPEVNWSGADNFVGAEFYTVPPARRFTLSLRTTF